MFYLKNYNIKKQNIGVDNVVGDEDRVFWMHFNEDVSREEKIKKRYIRYRGYKDSDTNYFRPYIKEIIGDNNLYIN